MISPFLFDKFCLVNNDASFNGKGLNDFCSYLQKELNNSKKESYTNGKIVVSFSVNSEGFVSDVKISHGLNSEMNSILIDILNNLPKWNPATSGGKRISQKFILPIIIN
jgi:hypothetical protein